MKIKKEASVIKGFATKEEAQAIANKLPYKRISIKAHPTFMGNLNYLIKYNGHYLLTKNKIFKEK